MAAAWRIATGSDGPSTTLTWGFSSAFQGSVVDTVYNNVNSSSPIDAVSSALCTTGGAGGTIATNTVTTTVANDLMVGLYAAASAKQSISLPGGSPLNPVVSQDDFGVGPSDFNAFNLTTNIGSPFGKSGGTGSYGPFGATQTQAGESVGVLLSLQPGL